MNETISPAGFSVQSFLTRIIPGLILLSPILIAFYLEAPPVQIESDIAWIIVGLAAVIFGELIEHVRFGGLRVPLPFSYMMYQSTGDESFLPGWFLKVQWIEKRLPFDIYTSIERDNRLNNRLQFDMVDHMADEFNLSLDTATSRDFYDALLLHLSGTESVKTQKARIAYVQSVNTKIGTIVAICFYLYYIFLQYPNPLWIIYAITAITIISIVFFISAFLTASPNMYVEMLEKEFYMDQMTE